QAASPATLLIAADEEGGAVQRLKPAKGFFSLPSHESLAARGPEAVRRAARQAGMELAECGINVDLAPVADVRRSMKSPGLGDKGRLFGSDPAAVSALDAAFSAGLRDAGVIPALKHFPGLGSADLDSHRALPDVTATWSEVELRPYADAFRSGWRGMVLAAHVLNRRLDPDAPASLSRPVITGLLRGRLGWNGVVISDDLQMGAVDGRTLDDVVEQAIAAGTDILLFGNNIRFEPGLHDRVFRIIMRLVREGRVTPERLRESWNRIESMKRACLTLR
ncbi:MAG: glycoside hydrolase family 3 protein, partial [Mailhella sp.]|nr:glycoside hydrolase family 3 protein [Mailhella sp.]